VASETRFFYSKGRQHLLWEFDLLRIQYRPFNFSSLAGGHCPLGEFGMVRVVARHAAHVASVVLATLPVRMITIARVTLKARCVCPSSLLWGLQFGWILYIRSGDALLSVLDVPIAIAVAGLTRRRSGVF